MLTWFRFYNSAHRHEKIRHLSNKLFRFWVICLEIASEHEGILPAFETISYETRLPLSAIGYMMDELIHLRLIDKTNNGLMPHNWAKYQYKSDNVTERVKRFRKRFGNVTSNVPRNGQTDSDKTDRVKRFTESYVPLTLSEKEATAKKYGIKHWHKCIKPECETPHEWGCDEPYASRCDAVYNKNCDMAPDGL